MKHYFRTIMTPEIAPKPDVLTKIGLVLLFLVIALYYITVQLFTINVPFCDEFHCVFMWLDQYHQKETVWQKFLSLFSQANEHRLFTFSLAVLTDYSLFGSVNMKRLAWEANLFMILLLYLVNLLNTTDRRNPWIILLIAFFLFVPQNEITNWPIVAFAAILQYSLVTASLWLLSRQGWTNLAGAILLATVATFSFGNGMITFAVGFLVLALKKPGRSVTWVIWAMAMVVAFCLYFQEYKFRGQTGLLTSAILNPIPVVQYFLTFFGTILIRIARVDLTWITVTGLIPLTILAYLLIYKWKEVKMHPTALAILLFMMISAAVAAVSRQKFGVIGATAPRYILMQALFLAVLFILILNIYGSKTKWLLPGLLCFAFFLYGARLTYGVFTLDKHHNHLKEILIAYNTDPEEINTHAPAPDAIRRIFDRSIHQGIYQPPEVKGELKRVKPFKFRESDHISEKLRLNIEMFNYDHGVLTMGGWAFSPEQPHQDLFVGIILQSDHDNLILRAKKLPRNNVKQHFAKIYPNLIVSTGFHLNSPLADLALQPGTYRVGICLLHQKDVIAMKFTDKSIYIAPSP